jgi:radical SAM superfamily enzyme YgiQ (UPF0313 family)
MIVDSGMNSSPTGSRSSRAFNKNGDAWKVLLINPPFQRLKGVYNLYFPLGLGYLASSLRKVSFECGIYNCENPQADEVTPHNHLSLLEQHWDFIKALETEEHFVWDEIKRTIRDFKPDIIGLSVLTPCYGSAAKINKMAKRIDPNIRIVWGGPHPTVQAREILRDEPEVEAIVMGEGEITFAELCSQIRVGETDWSGVNGVCYRGADDSMKITPPREFHGELDEMPFPDKSASLYIDAYFRDPERAQLGNLFGSRGCPFRCAYCSSHTIWSRRVRYRTPENILEEMETLRKDFGVERFSFLDDTFTMNRKWAASICDGIIDRGVKTRWGCYTRLDVLTEELILKMRAAGCAEMDVGIETGSPRMVDFLQKDIKLDRVREMAKVMNKHHMAWNSFIMMGLPDETLEDIQMTVDFIYEIKPLRAILSVFTPYPGDHLYEVCKSRGMIADKPDWSRFSHHSPENCFVKDIPKEEFEKIVRHVFMLIDRYNNSWAANYGLFRANMHLYVKQPVRFAQKAVSAMGRTARTYMRTTSASMDLARVSGRGSGI